MRYTNRRLTLPLNGSDECDYLHLSMVVRLDYCGIIVLIVTSHIPWLHFVFYCDSLVQLFYITSFLALGAMAICFVMRDEFRRPGYRWIRFCKCVPLHICWEKFGFVIMWLNLVWTEKFTMPLKLSGSQLSLSYWSKQKINWNVLVGSKPSPVAHNTNKIFFSDIFANTFHCHMLLPDICLQTCSRAATTRLCCTS